MHANDVVHANLKPSNILVSIPMNPQTKPVMKIAGFAVSRIVTGEYDGESSRSCDFIGPFNEWIAPEMINGSTITFSIDIFPLGCIFAFTINEGAHPFGSRSGEIDYNIRNNQPVIFNFVDEDLDQDKIAILHIINKMLDPDPTKRPTAANIFNSKYFNPTNANQCENFEVGRLTNGCRTCTTKPCRLGNGQYGIVFLGKYDSGSPHQSAVIEVAIKRVDICKSKVGLEILERAKHENILHYYCNELCSSREFL